MATYIDSFANLAGPLLGLSMSLSALLSGEMKDTANLGPLEPWPGGGRRCRAGGCSHLFSMHDPPPFSRLIVSASSNRQNQHSSVGRLNLFFFIVLFKCDTL